MPPRTKNAIVGSHPPDEPAAVVSQEIVPPPRVEGITCETMLSLATALGKLEIPHGGRLEHWSAEINEKAVLLADGQRSIHVAVSIRFPGMPRTLEAHADIVLFPGDWTIGRVATAQLLEAIAQMFGMATYRPAKGGGR